MHKFVHFPVHFLVLFVEYKPSKVKRFITFIVAKQLVSAETCLFLRGDGFSPPRRHIFIIAMIGTDASEINSSRTLTYSSSVYSERSLRTAQNSPCTKNNRSGGMKFRKIYLHLLSEQLKNTHTTMELTPASAASIQEALHKIAELYSSDEDQLLSTDFYLQPLADEGKLLMFNDNDEEIASVDVPEWEDYDADAFYPEVTAQLTAAIEEANADGDLERLAVWMPYSFVLVDKERETIADLLLVDDDTLLVKKGLLAGLDEELDLFIQELLND